MPTLPDRFTHSPPNPTPGQSIACSFANAALANQEIDVLVRADGEPHLTIPVKLDAAGYGTFDFTCPQADTLLLQQPTSADHAIVVA